MIQNDSTTEYLITSAISKGLENQLILDNVNTYIDFEGFKIPSMNIFFEKYRGIILENCVKITMSEKVYDAYKYRPKYLSYKLYGTVDLWHLLLWVNDMVTVSQFNKKIIYVLNPESLDVLDRILNLEKDMLDNNTESIPRIEVSNEDIVKR